MNLNAEVITLLTSISSKNLDNYIMDLQGQALNQLQLRLTDPNEGQRVLKLLLPFLPIAKISQLCNLIAEPWWLNLLRLSYVCDAHQLKKGHVPLAAAARLMGVPDPIGVLREGEIYCVIKVI